jgi:hypothetical protein
VVQYLNGVAHFKAALRNGALLKKALQALRLSDEKNARVLALYEEVFNHQSFTGRSGTFYKYEGFGCIYWYMVSKLLQAVQEVLNQAVYAGEDAAVVGSLISHYHEIREGIGVHKSPELYGAIPTNPYSHTPGFARAQQPGMTGQVKEDLISRLGELGVAVENGRLGFRRHLVSCGEFLQEERRFHFYDVDGHERSFDLDPDTMAFITCHVPVVFHRLGPQRIEITRADSSRHTVEALDLDAAISAAVFERTGAVRRLDVFFDYEGGR